jgi:sodium/proline symporter
VIGVSLVAILFALDPQSRILDLVAYAWAGFGAAFGPVVLFSLFWRRMTRNGAAAGLIVGAITVVVWKQLYGYGGIFEIYEMVPGFLLATLAVVGVSLLDRMPEPAVLADFDRAVEADATGIVAQPAE